MQRSDFFYDLPESLIAQHPVSPRSASRMLHVPAGGDFADRTMTEFPDLLESGDLLIFNDTRVIPARIYGVKDTGGKIEVLVERILDQNSLLAQIRASKTPKPGQELLLADAQIVAVIEGREGEFFRLRFEGEESVLEQLKIHGEMPLPPYIDRHADVEDDERYQTVYARREGAVAAPTAGLHFDEHLLNTIRGRGVEFGYITLHVGAGTFQPVRVDDLSQHQMHSEYIEVDTRLCQQIEEVKSRSGRVIGVGTTVVRALESATKAAQGSEITPFQGETRLFITPGYEFTTIDALLTNFHLPESTLLMLVTAFGGYDRVMAAYRHAVEKQYRFFSYGDAMFLETASSDGE